jgi:Spy/CpxP family protein refolding chaperone
MKKITAILILGVMVSITTGNAFSQQEKEQWRPPMERNRLLMGIPDLTEEQQDEIRDLRTVHLKEITPLRNEVKINNAMLQSLQTEDDPDMNEINGLIEKNGKLLTEIRKKQVAHKMEIRSLLTDEQKVFFDNRMQRTGRAAGENSQGRGMGPGRGYAYSHGRAGVERSYGYGQGRAGYGHGYRSNQGYAEAGWGRGYGRGPGY